MSQGPTIYPALSYRDAPAAIRWLEKAFGFRTLTNVQGEDGIVHHAEMAFGDGVIMLGSEKPAFGWASPLGLPAVNQSVYVIVDDPDAHYARAKEAGAEITIELQNSDWGSRGYSAKDIEGHQWSFGTYRVAMEGGR